MTIKIGVISKLISRILFIIFIAMIVAGVVGILYKEDYMPFIFSSIIVLMLCIILFMISKKNHNSDRLKKRGAYVIVTLSWLIMGITGCLPYLLSGAIPSFVDAFFESVSGFTTTGSSILIDIESLPKSILFWRSLTHWIGGIGIIVLVIIILPTFQIGGYHLFSLESSLKEKIHPKIKAVGIRLLQIYLGLTLIEVALLLGGGMNIFESLCHAFGSIATGGFSPKNDSIAGYSAYIQYVIMTFMLLSGTNFAIHYYLIRRDLTKVRNNEELTLYLKAILIVGLTISSILIFRMHKPVEESFREGFFQVISIITCTGFSTSDYLLWPTYAWVLIFLTMFLGGCSGSTSGGIKMVRHLTILKNFKRMIRQLIAPRSVIVIKINNKALNEESNTSILTFVLIYFLIYVSGTLIMILLGTDIKTAGGSVATCMAGIGPGLGSVGPAGNFAHLPDAGKILLSFLMLVGRLEIYTILVLFTKNFWKD